MFTRMKVLICRECGHRAPRHYMIGAVCYSCHLDSYIPDGYGQQERYRRDGPWPHANATRRPPLGVPFLDEGGDRVHQMALLAPRLRAVRWWCPTWGPRSRR